MKKITFQSPKTESEEKAFQMKKITLLPKTEPVKKKKKKTYL